MNDANITITGSTITCYRLANDTTVYLNERDEFHREDGPAIVGDLGEEWHVNGELHRLDGPALISVNGQHKDWYVHNKKITDEIEAWAEKMDVDLNNLSDDDKVMILLVINTILNT